MYNSIDILHRIQELVATSSYPNEKEMLLKAGVHPGTLSTMKSKGSIPKTDTMAKIADALNCSLDYLIGRSDDPCLRVQQLDNGQITLKKDSPDLTPDQINTLLDIIANYNNNSNQKRDTL